MTKHFVKLVFILFLLVTHLSVGRAFALTTIEEEEYRGAFSAWVKKDFNTALRIFKSLAKKNDANSQFLTGFMYLNGEGYRLHDKEPIDLKKAHYYFSLAANQGHAEAQNSLAHMYNNGKGVSQNKQTAYDWYVRAAAQGNINAKYNGANLIGDDGVSENDGRIKLKMLEEARQSGEIPRGFAENSIGWTYFRGAPGVEKDFKQAFYWSSQGCRLGAPNACSNVALQYFGGYGVTQDFVKTISFLLKSLEVWKPEDDWVLNTPDDAWDELRSSLPASAFDIRRLYWDAVLFKDGKHKTKLQNLASNQLYLEKIREQIKLGSRRELVAGDFTPPTLAQIFVNTKGKQGVIQGRAADNVGVAEVTISGQPLPFDAAGNFQYQTFIPTGGKDIVIEVTDVAGLTSRQTVSLTRKADTATATIKFESLNPLGRRVNHNKDALALIIGVDGYENTPARAIYADSDAQIFADYATEKLGVPANRIKTLVNDDAGERELLLSVKSWLSRSVKQNQSDVYIFFAGHGLASDDGSKMYLLPYDGAPELLDKTAILRDELFADISAANPRSVTVFLDTCYSGTTRGTDMLTASRPIAIRALEQSIPDNFTVMTAAAGDQTAKPLEEAKHGMFSYFLMKGMEGLADSNQDNKITAGELHQYVQSNVVQQSSGSQTPELQGDAERVLVRFQ